MQILIKVPHHLLLIANLLFKQLHLCICGNAGLTCDIMGTYTVSKKILQSAFKIRHVVWVWHRVKKHDGECIGEVKMSAFNMQQTRVVMLKSH